MPEAAPVIAAVPVMRFSRRKGFYRADSHIKTMRVEGARCPDRADRMNSAHPAASSGRVSGIVNPTAKTAQIPANASAMNAVGVPRLVAIAPAAV